MIRNLTKNKVEGVKELDAETQKVIDGSYKRKLLFCFEPKKPDRVKFTLRGKELVDEMHYAALSTAKLLKKKRIKEIYIGTCRTVYCAILESHLKALKIKPLYVWK